MINLGAGLAKIVGILKIGAGLPAIAGVVLAAAVGTYFVAPQLFNAGEERAAESAPVSPAVDSSASAPPTAPAEAPATEIASAEPAEPEGADSWVVPSFDVLRVEPDGSTVIAGKAEPGTKLNIMNGETVISSTEVGPSGDFAAVLDVPLAPGDYQLTLEIVGGDGQTRRSEEVATVSIPKEPGGDLLAMVSKPGKASRIIVQPEAPATETPVEVASAGSGEVGSEPAAPPATPEAPETATGTEAAPQAEAADSAGAGGAADPAQVETPALPEASVLLTTTAPEIAAATAAPEAGTAGTSEAAAAEEPATELALATPEAAAEPAATALPAGATVRVDAVEIEGDRIFVAGSATPGFPVRVSADGVVIGMEKADETGRFIIEATSELSVGDHIISADLMDSAGQEILLRATVPFNRPAGESLAAVAPSSPAPEPEAAAPEALILPDIASLSQMREDSFEALSTLEKLVSAPETPDAAAVSAAYEDAIARLTAAATADLPAGSSAEAMAMAQSMRAQAEAALAMIAPPAPDGASGAAVPGDLGKLRETVRQAETALTEPAPSAVAAANASDAADAADGQEAQPRTIVQAPLASAPGAVIIRRGDTLWQISRRTYGQGVRYTTIYVANRSQIQNPDRIKPGQVFSVPESPLENAEELHKQLLGGSNNP